MSKINPQLYRRIKQQLKQSTNTDQQKMIALLTADNSLRMQKECIKNGVKSYYNKNNINNNIHNQSNNNNQLHTPTKKIKPSQNQFEFTQNQPTFQMLGGIDEVIMQISREVYGPIDHQHQYQMVSKYSPNRGFLITGSIGAGKTTVGHAILIQLKNRMFKCFKINAFELTANDAEDKIKKLLQTAKKNAPSAIFFDDIDDICGKDANKRLQGCPSSMLGSHLDQLATSNLMVYCIASASSLQKLAILRKPNRFYKLISIPNPNQEERQSIIHKLLPKFKHSIQDSVKKLSVMMAGFVAVDIVNFFKEAMTSCVMRNKANPQKNSLQIVFEDCKEAIANVEAVLKREGFAKIPTTTLNDVGALEKVKQELIQEIILPMREKHKFKEINFEVNGGGVLLYGPPGCGKTMLAKAIANEARANFITVKGPELLTKYVGESEEAVRNVFQRAKLSSPCVIFFDEFDALAPKRQEQGNQVSQRVVNTLLNELNGVEERRSVFIIAATNRPDIIDEAVLRSGRIEKHLYVPMPNSLEREQILSKILSKVSQESNLQLKQISLQTDNFSGADLYFLVKKAVVQAISANRVEITQNDLTFALESYKEGKYQGQLGKEETMSNGIMKDSKASTQILNEFLDYLAKKSLKKHQ